MGAVSTAAPFTNFIDFSTPASKHHNFQAGAEIHSPNNFLSASHLFLYIVDFLGNAPLYTSDNNKTDSYSHASPDDMENTRTPCFQNNGMNFSYNPLP